MLKWFRKKEEELPEGNVTGSPAEGPASADSGGQEEEPQEQPEGIFPASERAPDQDPGIFRRAGRSPGLGEEGDR